MHVCEEPYSQVLKHCPKQRFLQNHVTTREVFPTYEPVIFSIWRTSSTGVLTRITQKHFDIWKMKAGQGELWHPKPKNWFLVRSADTQMPGIGPTCAWFPAIRLSPWAKASPQSCENLSTLWRDIPFDQYLSHHVLTLQLGTVNLNFAHFERRTHRVDANSWCLGVLVALFGTCATIRS